MPSAASGRYDSFVVRIWTQDRILVHGHATHILSRNIVSFGGFDRLIGFMLAHAQDIADHAPQARKAAPTCQAALSVQVDRSRKRKTIGVSGAVGGSSRTAGSHTLVEAEGGTESGATTDDGAEHDGDGVPL